MGTQFEIGLVLFPYPIRHVFCRSNSIAGNRALTLAETLTAAYAVKREFGDSTGAINAEFVPNFYFPVVTGRGKSFTIGM